jgi:hypothetical protein
MLNINEEDLKAAIVEKAADSILENDQDLSRLIASEVKKRLDKIFIERAEQQIQKAIDDAVVDAFNLEYQRVNNWGEAVGEKTTIKSRLDSIISGYWSSKVDPKSGRATDSSYSAVTRAEYLMTTICADDFAATMKQQVQNITGALKDGLRNQMGKSMDNILEDLFRIKSLQDQGKVGKPY